MKPRGWGAILLLLFVLSCLDGVEARPAFKYAGNDADVQCNTFGEVLAIRMWGDYEDILIGGGTKSPNLIYGFTDRAVGCAERYVPYVENEARNHLVSFPEQVFHNGVKGYYSNVTAIGI